MDNLENEMNRASDVEQVKNIQEYIRCLQNFLRDSVYKYYKYPWNRDYA